MLVSNNDTTQGFNLYAIQSALFHMPRGSNTRGDADILKAACLAGEVAHEDGRGEWMDISCQE
jgi:hypothetical protein